MTEFDLFETIGNIDDDKITYAADKRKSYALLKITSLAAALAIIIFTANSLVPVVKDPTPTSDPAPEFYRCPVGELPDSAHDVDLPTQDKPVNEDDFHYLIEHCYSKEIMTLHTRISNAMANKELPFVIFCGIYENPIRVTVLVNTKDESLLDKLRSYDSTGDILEIKYVPLSATPELMIDKKE